MKGISHLIIGTSVSAVVSYNILGLSDTHLLSAIAVGSVASVFPDIDAEESLIKSAVRGGGRSLFTDYIFSSAVKRDILGSMVYGIVSAFEISIRSLLVLLIELVHLVFKHRGLTHGIPAAILVSLVSLGVFMLLQTNLLYSLVFFVGYLTHLFGDATTVSGLKLLQPFSRHIFHIFPKALRIRTGYEISFLELVVVFVISTTCIAVLYFTGL